VIGVQKGPPLTMGFTMVSQTLNQRVIRSVADLTDLELESLLASETEHDNDQLRH
jgi:hypothetical protein